jgi:hypothetical protein
MRLALALKIAVVTADMAVAVEVEDKVGDGVSNRPT